jgi:hypothetical protein
VREPLGGDEPSFVGSSLEMGFVNKPGEGFGDVGDVVAGGEGVVKFGEVASASAGFEGFDGAGSRRGGEVGGFLAGVIGGDGGDQGCGRGEGLGLRRGHGRLDHRSGGVWRLLLPRVEALLSDQAMDVNPGRRQTGK